jgi:hypothetical protein
MTTKCYEDPYKHWEMLPMLQKSPRILPQKQKWKPYIYKRV